MAAACGKLPLLWRVVALSLLKPASHTPITSLMLANIAQTVDLPPGVFNVLPGPGGGIGMDIATHPLIKKIAFTGDGQTGATIVKAAANDIKRVSLELGGKSPNIIFADANIEKAGEGSNQRGIWKCWPKLLCPHPNNSRKIYLQRINRYHGRWIR